MCHILSHLFNFADHVEAEHKAEYLKSKKGERSDNVILFVLPLCLSHHHAYRGAGYGQYDLGVVVDEGLKFPVAAGQFRGEPVVFRSFLTLLGKIFGDAVSCTAAARGHFRLVGEVRVVGLPVCEAFNAAAFELKETVIGDWCFCFMLAAHGTNQTSFPLPSIVTGFMQTSYKFYP